MKEFRLFRHPDCPKCAKIARVHEIFDWHNRLEVSTATPKTGALRMGEIVIEELATGTIFRGADAFGLLCRRIPLYAPLSLLLRSAAFRRYITREMSGCGDTSRGIEPPGSTPTK